MPVTTIKREMFTVTIDETHAEIRIVRNPNLDSATGARNARDVSAEGKKLTLLGVQTILLDVSEAPPVAGPQTTEALSSMFKSWEKARVRVAVLVSEDPIMKLQFRRLVSEHAPRAARVFGDVGEAKAWLAQ